jgi:hypothetical protein
LPSSSYKDIRLALTGELKGINLVALMELIKHRTALFLAQRRKENP